MICDKTMEIRSSSFIMQSISMEAQRRNLAYITATVDSPKSLNELFELFHTNEDYFGQQMPPFFYFFRRTELLIYNIVELKYTQ